MFSVAISSVFPHNQKPSSPSLQTSDISHEDDNMPIHVSDNLQWWRNNKGLQGYLRVADSKPHPRTTEVIQSIDITKLINKQVHRVLNLKREGFDAVQKWITT